MEFLRGKLDARDIAHFRLGPGYTCLEGTRIGLLRRIEQWYLSNDPANPENIFWLYGHAGSGKSTVANTVAAMAQRQGRLLSCFVCKRDDEFLSDPKHVLPTIAFRFAEQHDSYRVKLMDFFRRGTDYVGITQTVDVRSQLERLFTNILPDIPDPCEPHLILIDAPDELKLSEQKALMESLLSLSAGMPWVKIFVTSRDESSIRDAFDNKNAVVSANINELSDINHDIRVYLESQPLIRKLQLTDAEIDSIVERSQGLFIWCTTLLAFLSDDDDLMSDADLRSMLLDHDNREPFQPLYSLYDQVVTACIKRTKADISSFIHTLLAVIYFTSVNRPLSSRALGSLLKGLPCFLRRDVGHIDNAVKRLHAVLYVDTAAAVVRAHHASFYDYVQTRISQDDGWSTETTIQPHIARRCLSVLNSQLRFNICCIEKPVLNKDIPDLPKRIRDHVPEILQYSSLFWSRHLSEAMATNTSLENNVSQLMSTEKVLFWVELLSLQNALADGATALERAGQLFAVSWSCKTYV